MAAAWIMESSGEDKRRLTPAWLEGGPTDIFDRSLFPVTATPTTTLEQTRTVWTHSSGTTLKVDYVRLTHPAVFGPNSGLVFGVKASTVPSERMLATTSAGETV